MTRQTNSTICKLLLFVFGNVSTQNDYPVIRVPGNVMEPPEIWETKKLFPVSLDGGWVAWPL